MTATYTPRYGLNITFPNQTIRIGLPALNEMDLIHLSQYIDYLKEYYE